MRIGVFGGSFDPVHIGHLWIANAAVESLALDQLHLVPAAQSPLKPQGTHASAEQRLQMLRLAVSGNSDFQINDLELTRGDVSYTVDTLTQLRAEHVDAEIFLIVGSDSLASFPEWHQPERVLQLAELAVVQRGGEPELDFSVLAELTDSDTIAHCQSNVIKMPVIEISSSEIRQRVSESRSIRYRVTRPVEALIQAQALYKN